MPLVGSVGRCEWFQSGDVDPNTDRRNISGADVKAAKGKTLRDGFMVIHLKSYIHMLTSFMCTYMPDVPCLYTFRRCLTAIYIECP